MCWKGDLRFRPEPRAPAEFTRSIKSPCRIQRQLHSRITLSDMSLITTVDGQRIERQLGGDEEAQAVLREKFGIL